jgi:uncharacterized protein YybS (DUF2232 family)
LGPRAGLFALGVPLGLALLSWDQDGMGGMWVIHWVAMGPLFVEAFRRAKTLEGAMAGFLISSLSLQAALVTVQAVELGVAPWTLVEKGMETSITRALQSYGVMGMAPEGQSYARDVASAMARVLSALAPGMLVALDLLLGWWTLIAHRWILRLRGLSVPGPETLKEWAMPAAWVWVTIVGGLLMLLPGALLPFIGVNLLVVMGVVHFLQGIGVVATFFHSRRVPPVLRGVFYALVFLQQVFLLGVVAIGLFDLWFDFRRRWSGAA